MVYPGFGLNYKAASANWNNDLAFFQLIGLSTVRCPLSQMAMIKLFIDAGFYVSTGPSAGSTLTVENWPTYAAMVLSTFENWPTTGYQLGDMELGNELEDNLTATVSSLTQVGGIATAITAAPHGFITGSNVTMQNFTPNGYNGTFSVTVINSTTFTYSVSSSLASPALSGTPIAWDLSITQLHANLRTLGAQCQAARPDIPVSYHCYNAQLGGVFAYTDFLNNGIAGINYLAIHPYGNINISNQTVSVGGFAYVQEMIQAFGSQCYISEFNLDAGNSNLLGLNPIVAATTMTSFLNTYILGNNVSRFMLYMWSETMNDTPLDLGYAQILPNGAMNPMWFTFFESNPTEYATANRPVASRSSVARSTVSRLTVTRPLFNSSS